MLLAIARPTPRSVARRPAAIKRTPTPRSSLVCRADTARGLTQLLEQAQTTPENLTWTPATVVENREASADGSVRTLLLSVEDRVNFLEGRKVRHVQQDRRWIDDYRVPGQFVAARYCSHDQGSGSTDECSEMVVARRLLSLASSPYEARRDSALLDASLVELLVSRTGDDDERLLAELGPGSMIEVSRVAGEGFASLFNSSNNLVSCLEAGHPLLVIAAGVRGIAPVRAALSWTPVLAHAGSSRVNVFYIADSQTSAAYLVEWDMWREAGVVVNPLYLADGSAGNGAEQLLETALLDGPGGLAAVLGSTRGAKDAAVLISGLDGEAAARLTRKLVALGVSSENVMVAEY
ncbi:hypothetical protein D9Q98_001120 [Chlorella vulgaris]|uniref:FAD-binding FR-type domain-containing protein n=1 Tax=Chlorella vulgaris TaxID=3077 RepID=A0A9D4Z2A8_CHLVU|nr:hypothetical protein D9Q98_001120 [Chlorella vulgaris]